MTEREDLEGSGGLIFWFSSFVALVAAMVVAVLAGRSGIAWFFGFFVFLLLCGFFATQDKRIG